MGGHDVKFPPIPDWRIYKVDDAPKLVEVRKRLEKSGLKYHWLRNEVWKYHKDTEIPFFKKVKFFMTGGMKYGIPAGIITAILEKVYKAHLAKTIAEAGGDHH